MRNALEYTILEVDALCHGDLEAPHKELAVITRFIFQKQREQHLYQVIKDRKQIASKEPVSRRKAKSADAELLDSAEIVLETEGGYGEQGNGVDVTEFRD
jgi:hypothetical protein